MLKVALIGKPNAGKSTLFNALIKERKAITTRIPGTTRDWKEEVVSFNDSEFILADTAGIELKVPKDDELKVKAQEKIEQNLKMVDLFIFVADKETGITQEDTKIIRDARKYGKEMLPVVNKIDHLKDEVALAEFNKLGLGEPLGVSAERGNGLHELRKIIQEKIINSIIPSEAEEFFNEGKGFLHSPLRGVGRNDNIIKVSIVGRPNAGKSSFLNKLIDEDKFIVSEIPGTTRDVNSTVLKYKETDIKFLDTAGLRRRGKIGKVAGKSKEGIVEKFSADRTKKALDESDISILIVDAADGITSQDMHIAGYIKDAGNGVIIVVNKSDLFKDGKLHHAWDSAESFTRLARHKFEFLPYAPLIFVSSLTGKNVDKVLDLILKIKEKREKRIQTGELNDFFNKVILKKPPVSVDKHQVNIKYATQVDINPPKFVFFTNYPEKVHFSYQRYLENRIRENWDFTGTAIKINFRPKSKA